jgi:pimeloyl-ACP methyl ester carboxylesterase
MKTGFLLLPGGGMSSWIWEKVIPALRAPSIAPEYRLPVNTRESRTTATIADCVAYHLKLMNESNIDRFVIVGHSGAGALAAAIARAAPEKTASVVYVSANIPRNHTTTLDALPFLLKHLNKTAIKKQVEVDSTPMAKHAAMVKKYFCNTCDGRTIDFMLSHQMFSEPLCVAFEPFNYDDFPSIPQTFIMLTKDKTQNEKRQLGMMKNLGVTEVKKIESDHMVMLSKPEELAGILNAEIGKFTP